MWQSGTSLADLGDAGPPVRPARALPSQPGKGLGFRALVELAVYEVNTPPGTLNIETPYFSSILELRSYKPHNLHPEPLNPQTLNCVIHINELYLQLDFIHSYMSSCCRLDCFISYLVVSHNISSACQCNAKNKTTRSGSATKWRGG